MLGLASSTYDGVLSGSPSSIPNSPGLGGNGFDDDCSTCTLRPWVEHVRSLAVAILLYVGVNNPRANQRTSRPKEGRSSGLAACQRGTHGLTRVETRAVV
jgi:hypothetical protein